MCRCWMLLLEAGGDPLEHGGVHWSGGLSAGWLALLCAGHAWGMAEVVELLIAWKETCRRSGFSGELAVTCCQDEQHGRGWPEHEGDVGDL